MKILAFSASSSSRSINKQLAKHASSLVKGAEVTMLDLNDYELPLFSEDKERELGQPQLAKDFLNEIHNSDAVIISFAEHNGSYSAAYKNIFDWSSRINPKVFQDKPMIMLATSPGKSGGASVLATAVSSAPYFAGNVVGSYSVPSFYDNYDFELGQISNGDIRSELQTVVNKLLQNMR
jgi:NAD(P)H-dependent FMN reductase